jgi:hypothetical protein
MSEEEIRSRTVQELGTEIRRLVTLLEAIAIEPGVGRRFEKEEEPQPIVLPDLIAPELEVQIAVPQRVEDIPVPQTAEATPVIEVGDLVVIINRYRGLRGQTGRVIRTTQRQVVVRLNESGRVITKRKTSVQVINNT